jgi:hypothetical protein
MTSCSLTVPGGQAGSENLSVMAAIVTIMKKRAGKI